MSIFNHREYKAYLKEFIERNQRRGIVTELAKAAGCTHSYLSQVIHGKPELTPDQALASTEFLGLKGEEPDYFLAMVFKSRAASAKLQGYFERRMKEIRDRSLELGKAVSKTSDLKISLSDRDFYYSTWITPAVHILTSCPEYQKSEAISSRLGVPQREVEKILDWLVDRDLLKRREGRHLHSGKNIHLPTQSVHNQINHMNWRLRGLGSSTDPSVVHYTSLFTISRKDWDKLRSKLLAFIEEQRGDIGESGAEEPVVFCCDLFKV